MSKTSHNQSLLFHLRVLIDGLLVTFWILPVPLEIVQLRFSFLRSVWMGTWSGTLLYHTLASFHLGNMKMMLDLFMLGDPPPPPPYGANDTQRMQMITV